MVHIYGNSRCFERLIIIGDFKTFMSKTKIAGLISVVEYGVKKSIKLFSFDALKMFLLILKCYLQYEDRLSGQPHSV